MFSFLRTFTPEKGRKAAALVEADAFLESILAESKQSNVQNAASDAAGRRAQLASEEASNKLRQIASSAFGLTPRTLEKLPLLVFSKHVVRRGRNELELADYLDFLDQEVKAQFRELKELSNGGGAGVDDYSVVGRRSR